MMLSYRTERALLCVLDTRRAFAGHTSAQLQLKLPALSAPKPITEEKVKDDTNR